MPTATQARPAWQNALFTQLHKESGAQKYGLSVDSFSDVLAEVCEKHLSGGASEREGREFLAGLRLNELALARACAAGSDAAWTEFLNRYRAALYGAALAITRDDSRGRELADSLYAELYGMKLRENAEGGQQRVSKLSFYTGRGSLEGWLRAVLAQQYVDRYRKQKREVSLEEETDSGGQFAAPPGDPAPDCDPRVSAATDAVLAELESEERFLLSAYFLDGRTLAEIGRTLKAHESTISRKLERTVTRLRKQIVKRLLKTGMSPRAAEEALQVDVRDLAVNVRERLRPPPEQERV